MENAPVVEILEGSCGPAVANCISGYIRMRLALEQALTDPALSFADLTRVLSARKIFTTSARTGKRPDKGPAVEDQEWTGMLAACAVTGLDIPPIMWNLTAARVAARAAARVKG